MFRKMRRFKQQISEEDCIHLLEQERRGVLSLHGEDGYPYGLPINFVYDEGKIYFHGAGEGHKIDAIRADSRASFCVYNAGVPVEGKVGLQVESVIVFGKIALMSDREKSLKQCEKLGLKYYSADYIEKELKKDGSRVQMLEMTIDHMTGKTVNES